MIQGTVEYEEVILPIVGIGLRDGAFVVQAEGDGPADPWHGRVRVIGPDGVLVQQGGIIDCPAAEKGQRLRLELTLTPESPDAR